MRSTQCSTGAPERPGPSPPSDLALPRILGTPVCPDFCAVPARQPPGCSRDVSARPASRQSVTPCSFLQPHSSSRKVTHHPAPVNRPGRRNLHFDPRPPSIDTAGNLFLAGHFSHAEPRFWPVPWPALQPSDFTGKSPSPPSASAQMPAQPASRLRARAQLSQADPHAASHGSPHTAAPKMLSPVSPPPAA